MNYKHIDSSLTYNALDIMKIIHSWFMQNDVKLSNAIESSQPLLERAEVSLSINIPTTPIHLNADPTRSSEYKCNARIEFFECRFLIKLIQQFI
jgi:hypothetical protein